MSIASHVSLINLSKQLPFEIDDETKKAICFAETLIISCGHYEGDICEESSDSEWSCSESIKTPSEEIKDETVFEIKDRVEESVEEEQKEEYDNFHLYFFPDCKKPLPSKDSKASLLIVDGFPQLNPAAQQEPNCTCQTDKTGKCPCHLKTPCKCGAKTQVDCTCELREDICICDEKEPKLVCTCKGSNLCLCHPDGLPRPTCVCNKIQLPCICDREAFPHPICKCKQKPGTDIQVKRKSHDASNVSTAEDVSEELSYESDKEEETKAESSEKDLEPPPCICQVPPPKPPCRCKKGQECTCTADACVCGVQKICDCLPDERKDIDDPEKKSICSCAGALPICTCDMKDGKCKCFPELVCTCDDPEDCICRGVCECPPPCICEALQPQVCSCAAKDYEENLHKASKEALKLKKVKGGKDGYRWCTDVDPHHTFFDYGYDRHNLISYKEELQPKVHIMGLHDEVEVNQEPETNEIKAPPYKKKVRKPSLDCCSAVGGININVEALGEDKDKFLIQVVSHSSKEGAKTGTKIISIVDNNLHTMEENRVENITKRDFTKERRSYMAICETGYYNKITRICGEQTVVKRLYHSFETARNFLLEGANVILMRYFAIRRYRGSIKTDTVMIGGHICESVYVCHGTVQAIVNGKPLFVQKVERHIIEPGGHIHQTLTILTLRGYMVSHEWADSNYVMHMNPLLEVYPERDEVEEHAPLREKWREDLQLLSDYLDHKSTRTSEGGRYLTENGQLTATVRDYLQTLLMLKPADALHFTRHYFESELSTIDLPHDEYFDSCGKHVRYFFFEE